MPLTMTSIEQKGSYPVFDPYYYEGWVNFNPTCSACPPPVDKRFSQRLHFVDTNLPCGLMTGLSWPWKNAKQLSAVGSSNSKNNELFMEQYSNKKIK